MQKGEAPVTTIKLAKGPGIKDILRRHEKKHAGDIAEMNDSIYFYFLFNLLLGEYIHTI